MKKMTKEQAQQMIANAQQEARLKMLLAYDYTNRWHKKHDFIFWAMFLGVAGMTIYAMVM